MQVQLTQEQCDALVYAASVGNLTAAERGVQSQEEAAVTESAIDALLLAGR